MSIACELRSLDDVIKQLPELDFWVGAILGRLEDHLIAADRPRRALDVGCAQGMNLIVLQRRGFEAHGVEPFDEAREVAAQLAEYHHCQVEMRSGSAENIPYPESFFDLVIATSVIEHVDDLEKSFSEIYRVLRPGGVFWFNSASSRCPKQDEIHSFPFFGWYPNAIKLRVMEWAKNNRPALVGHSDRPAIHWFTPSKARRKLRDAGFGQVLDRWDLRQLNEESGVRRSILQLIKTNGLTKFVADVVVSGCSYAAVKPST